MKKIEFGEYSYYLTAKGYYSRREHLHRVEWIFYNGKIPDNHVIHHRNFNPSDNDLSNLQCMTISEHRSLHCKVRRIGEARRSISISISERSKRIEVRGRRYCLYKDGYYVRRVSLHRDIYEDYHGPLPKGFIVHHVNGVRSDNAIENLKAMTNAKHAFLHHKGKVVTDETRMKISDSHKNRLPITDETKQKMRDAAKSRPKRECICEECGKAYMTMHYTRSRYCNKSCIHRAYRKRNLEKLKEYKRLYDAKRRRSNLCLNIQRNL